jgi:hypothetical protein
MPTHHALINQVFLLDTSTYYYKSRRPRQARSSNGSGYLPDARTLRLLTHGRRMGFPATIRVDQGSEFVSRDLVLWAYQRGVMLDFSRPSKPTDNAFIEAFNGRFRQNVSTPTGS